MRLLIPLAALSILAACGGPGKQNPPAQSVSGHGFTFSAPDGWTVRRTAVTTTASSGGQLVSVNVFPLRRAYAPSLFPQAAKELDRVAAKLAAGSHGTLGASATITIAGRRARSYRYATRTYDAQVGFVLQGRYEYELYCQVPKGADDAACRLLLASFTLG